MYTVCVEHEDVLFIWTKILMNGCQKRESQTHAEYSRRHLGTNNAKEVCLIISYFIDLNINNKIISILIYYRNNIGYVSTCKAVSVLSGIIISSLFLTVFTSEDFCNKYLRFTPATGEIVTKACKIIWSITYVIFIYYITKFTTTNGKIDFPIYYYVILVFIFIIYYSLLKTMRVAKVAWFNRISDPRFGGTYMTLWNTLSFISMYWLTTIAIFMMDFLTFKECSLDY
ncbi:hypothetical protein AGLY_017596 [Aphis glycines]|uniref:Uncharacterized protein n=1 Tax=Aphis glycines TaxID=307491 RepID=A0A6G0SUF0_APHGL|nr:hypothetical protein AGLY_017596 [Aphis glycines]